jgi:hypothetical protein
MTNPMTPINPNDAKPPQKSDGTRTSVSELARRVGVAWNLLMGRPFSPGVPVEPLPGTQNQLPRQWQFTVAQNTQRMPRGESVSYTPFSQLRQLATSYDIAALCIATRVEQVQGLQWSIVPRDKRKQADSKVMSRVEALTNWWKYPDRVNDFSSWVGMLIYDVMSIDAMTLYRRRTRSGHLYALEVVDGATIKPIIDNRGRTTGYQQVLWGETVSDYSRAYADAPDEQLFFTPHDMIYRPRYQRSFTPYGFPPTEWVIVRVNTALRKQSLDLAHFTDGNIPDMIAAPPEGLLDPNQLREFEEMFNADLAGNDKNRSKIKFIPFNMNLRELMPFNYSTEIDRWMMNVTVAAFGVTPSELGFTEDVNRATALAQESITYRRGIEGISNWLKTLFDRMLAEDFRSPDLEWQWHFGKADDRMLLAQLDQIYTGMGVISPEEVRALRFGNVLEGPSPAAEAAGVGRQKEQMEGSKELGVDKLSSSWTTMSKADTSEHPFVDVADSPLKQKITITTPNKTETVETTPNSQMHTTEESYSTVKTDKDSENSPKFDDSLRNSLYSALDVLLKDSYVSHKNRIVEAMHSSPIDTKNSFVSVVYDYLKNEANNIENELQSSYEDALRMGVAHGLKHIHQSAIANEQDISELASSEANRLAEKIVNRTKNNFEDIIANKPNASINEIASYVFAPRKIEEYVLPEVNRLFNLGIKLAGKTHNVKKIKWIAQCNVCTSKNNIIKNIDSEVLPGLHSTCNCIIELQLE